MSTAVVDSSGPRRSLKSRARAAASARPRGWRPRRQHVGPVWPARGELPLLREGLAGPLGEVALDLQHTQITDRSVGQGGVAEDGDGPAPMASAAAGPGRLMARQPLLAQIVAERCGRGRQRDRVDGHPATVAGRRCREALSIESVDGHDCCGRTGTVAIARGRADEWVVEGVGRQPTAWMSVGPGIRGVGMRQVPPVQSLSRSHRPISASRVFR